MKKEESKQRQNVLQSGPKGRKGEEDRVSEGSWDGVYTYVGSEWVCMDVYICTAIIANAAIAVPANPFSPFFSVYSKKIYYF
jgi:hypothetical protein